MNALDKLANMAKHVGRRADKESQIFKQLLSTQQCETCCQIYQERADSISSEVSSALVQLMRDVYKAMHDHSREEMGQDADEDQVLERLYHQRNLRHGTFLKEDQFQQMFGRSKGTVATEVVIVAFLLTLALALDPRRFLQLDP
jgi:hypothetical protein